MSGSGRDDRQGGMSTSGLVVALVAAAGALVWHFQTLQTSRPGLQEPRSHISSNLQRMEARLWQDPFESVETCRKEGTPPEGLPSVLRQVSDRFWNRFEVLGIMVDGSRYAGASEARRRARYAVLSALHVSGYVPDNPYYLGVASLTAAPGPAPSEDALRLHAVSSTEAPVLHDGLLIPFEVHMRRDFDPKQNGAVVVLWIDENVCLDHTVAMLHGILDVVDNSLIPAQGRRSVIPGEKPGDQGHPGGERMPKGEVKFIGPQSSSTLKRMLHEIHRTMFPIPPVFTNKTGSDEGNVREPWRLTPRACVDLLGRAWFFSPTATVDESELLDLPGGNRRTLADHLGLVARRQTARFLRTTPTDGLLATALARELILRGIDLSPESRKSHVVLLSEWDTAYGLALPKSIREEIEHSVKGETASRIHVFSYPRSLDGRKAGEVKDVRKTPQAAGEAKEGQKQGQGEQDEGIDDLAEGDGQYDYLLRLAGKLEEMDNRLKQRGEEIGAIGVFGTDAYDKILALRALKPRFPGAVYFTTDLDARFLRKRDSEYCRNLVVASAFGFELHSDLQRDVLPFRGSYQTSQYLAALMALNFTEADWNRATQEAMDRRLSRARIYEIGRTRAIEMPPEANADGPGEELFRLDSDQGKNVVIRDIQPEMPVYDRNRWHDYALVLIPGVFLIVFIAPYAFRWLKFILGIDLSYGTADAECDDFTAIRKDRVKNRRMCRIIRRLAIMTLVAIVLAGLAVAARNAMVDEPFYWFEGISIWPTEIIRSVAIVLAVVFLVFGVFRLDSNHREIDGRYMSRESGIAPRVNGDAEGGGPPVAKDFVKEKLSTWSCFGVYKYILLAGMDCKFTESDGACELKDSARTAPPSEPATPSNEAKSAHRVEDLWLNYHFQSRWWVRSLRVCVAMVFFFMLALSLIRFFGFPHVPYRGGMAGVLDHLILVSMIVSFVFLLFFVVDATRLCKLFATRFIKDTVWPGKAREEIERQWGLVVPGAEGDVVKDLCLDIRVFGKLSEPVVKLIYYPCIILALIIGARSTLFDRWESPMGLVIVFLMSFILAVYCAVDLRWTAEKIRTLNMERLSDIIIKARGREDMRMALAQYEDVLARMRDSRTGAFAPFMQQPVFRAVLLPFGSIWAVKLLDYVPFL